MRDVNWYDFPEGRICFCGALDPEDATYAEIFAVDFGRRRLFGWASGGWRSPGDVYVADVNTFGAGSIEALRRDRSDLAQKVRERISLGEANAVRLLVARLVNESRLQRSLPAALTEYELSRVCFDPAWCALSGDSNKVPSDAVELDALPRLAAE